MNYWQKLSTKLKEADFDDEYIKIIIQFFGNRSIEEFMYSSPIAVAEAITQYAATSGLYFFAMPDDISDAQQIAKELYEEIKKSEISPLPEPEGVIEKTSDTKTTIKRKDDEMKASKDLKKEQPVDQLLKRIIGKNFDLFKAGGISSLAKLRTIDTKTFAVKKKFKQAGVTEEHLEKLKSSANLAGIVSDPNLLDALMTVGIDSLKKLAIISPEQIQKDINSATKDGVLNKEKHFGKEAIRKAHKDAREFYDLLAGSILVPMIPVPMSTCRECGDGCDALSPWLSPFSKSAYINYLARKMELSTNELSERFFQDFATANAEEISVVRLGIEVLEKALAANEFSDVDLTELYRLEIADRMIVRQAMLTKIQRLSAKKRKEAEDEFVENPLEDLPLTNSAELADTVSRMNSYIDAFDQWLHDPENSTLGHDIIDSVWLRASRDEFERAALELGAGWEQELAILGTYPDTPFVVDYALKYREKLIAFTGKNASALREKYHINFMATKGRIERCEQAILTLQEALRCNQPQYLSCCEKESDDKTRLEIVSKIKNYDAFRLSVEQKLYPQNFYDLHWKTPLIRGDVANLRQQLNAASDALETITARNEDQASLMGLFREGLQTVGGLLDLDKLIAEGHRAFRDEEYNLALTLYQQASEHIRIHVDKFHSAKLASYEEIFALDSSSGSITGCDGNTYLADASTLLETLERASLCPSFTRKLITKQKLQKVEEASKWWPSEGSNPKDIWNDFISNPAETIDILGPNGILAQSNIIRFEDQLTKLRTEALPSRPAGWDIHDTPDGVRFSLPFILRNKPTDNDAFFSELNDAQDTLMNNLITNAQRKIEGKLADLYGDIEKLRSCLLNVWGNEDILVGDFVNQISGTATCLNNFSNDLAGKVNVISFITDCSCIKIKTIAFLPVPYLDPNCVIDKIITTVEYISTVTYEDIYNDFSSMPENIKEAVNQGIIEWLGNDWSANNLENIAGDARGSFGTFGHDILEIILKHFLIEDESVWIYRDDALQEVSNLYNDEDRRKQRKLRRGAILFDKEGAGNAAYSTFTGNFVINTGDNDDLGVVFRFSEEGNNAGYYLLSLRSGKDEEAEHDSKKGGMEAAWSLLVAGLFGSKLIENAILAPWLNLLVLPVGGMAAFATWIAGIGAIEYFGEDVFPVDSAGHFVRLLKVKQSSGNHLPVVTLLASNTDFIIEKDKDYALRVDVAQSGAEAVSIKIELSEPGSNTSLLELHAVDEEPLGAGGVGLYAFANSKAMFKKADVNYAPCGSDSLGKLLFLPEQQVPFETNAYDQRIIKVADDLHGLSESISVPVDGLQIVRPMVSRSESDNTTETVEEMVTNEAVDLSLYGIENDMMLQYHIFDPHVDRYALAELTNNLESLLPHYYFFILPLSIADALHAAGDYERAKQHYDVVLDLFSNEILLESEADEEHLFADPKVPNGYSYLNQEIETGLVRARHAANYLAAGEAAFTINTPESRQSAYEHFSKVLLSYERKSCCSDWNGNVFCSPGAPDENTEDMGPLTPVTPFDTAAISVDLHIPETGEDECTKRLAVLEEMISRLPSDRQKEIQLEIKKLNQPFANNREKMCSELRKIIRQLEKELKTEQSCKLTMPEKWLDIPSTEKDHPEWVTFYESAGKKGMQEVNLMYAYAKNGISFGKDGGKKPYKPDYIDHTLTVGTAITPTQEEERSCRKIEEQFILNDLLNIYRCVPENPLTLLHIEQACMYMDMLDDGLNVLGLREEDLTSYKYAYLLELARTFTGFAIGAEKDFIQFREKLASARLSMMQQEHAIELLGSQARVQQLTNAQAALQRELTDYQLGMTRTRDSHLDELLALNDAEMVLAVLGAFAGAGQGVLGIASAGIGTVGAAAGVVAAVPTGGASLVVSVASLGVAGVGVASAGVGAAGGILGGIQGVFNVYKQGVMLEQQQELLRNYELPMAHINQQNAELQQRISQRQIEIGRLEMRFAKHVLTYLSHQFLNADMYSFLARLSKQHYKQYLDYATHAARMAERVLEVERGHQSDIIKLNYFDVSVQGLLGGEGLQQDLATLEYQRFIQDDNKISPPGKLFSLANSFPLEFEHFRHTGKFWFRTTHLDFDRDFPGHYQRQIRSVRVMVLALVGQEGIKASLSQIGSTETIVREDNRFVVQLSPGATQTVPLTGTPDGHALMPVNLANEKINPFESNGVVGNWLLDMPRAANQIDYGTIVDVMFMVEYSAYSDSQYQKEVQESLYSQTWLGSRTFRFSLNFPDAFYHILNPEINGYRSTTSLLTNLQTTVVTIGNHDYPHNEMKRTLDGITIGIFDCEGNTLQINKISLASHRHIESLWRSGKTKLKMDPISTPYETRVFRGGELLQINEADVRSGEQASTGTWNRVLRDDQIIWVPDGLDQTGDVVLENIDPMTTSLIQPVPEELLRMAQVAVEAFVAEHPYTHENQHAFELRLHDDGTPPRQGQKRVLRDNELIWVDTIEANDIEKPEGEWVRVLEDTEFNWKLKTDAMPEGVFQPEDKWYLTIEHKNNPELAMVNVSEYEVIDLSEVKEIVMLMNYSYKLPG